MEVQVTTCPRLAMKLTMNNRKIQVWLQAILMIVLLLALVAGWAMLSIKGDMEAVRNDLATLRKDQQDLHKALADLRSPGPVKPVKQKPNQTVDLSTADAPDLGDRNAPVTLLEFTDYQCPFCRRHAINTMPRLVADYVKAGKLRYVIREMPVEVNHPLAGKAAEAALCANDQDKYWEMHDMLFENQDQLEIGDLKSHARALHLDAGQFDRCLDSGEKRGQIVRDVQAGKQAGMRGTPAFFLGLTKPGHGDSFQAIEVIHGAKEYQEFVRLINALLSRQATEKTTE